MKNVIKENYNIIVYHLNYLNENTYSFYVDYDKYYFKVITRPIEEINEIYYLLNGIINKFHQIILNNKKEILTEFNNKNYILYKVLIPENIENNLVDLLNTQIKINIIPKLIRTNWGELWSRKIDYLEYQISELSIKRKIVTNSFSYFLGMAENAIELFNSMNLNSEIITISRKRIFYPNNNITFYDPLDIIIDYRVRDIAEYIKSYIFNEKINTLMIIKTLKKYNFSQNEWKLLIVRLLYPSFYFDDLQEVLENKRSENILLKYIENAENYRKFLKELIINNKKNSYIDIPWLLA